MPNRLLLMNGKFVHKLDNLRFQLHTAMPFAVPYWHMDTERLALRTSHGHTTKIQKEDFAVNISTIPLHVPLGDWISSRGTTPTPPAVAPARDTNNLTLHFASNTVKPR